MTDNQEVKALRLKWLAEEMAKDYVTDSNGHGAHYEPYVKYFKYALSHKSVKQLTATPQKLDVAVEALKEIEGKVDKWYKDCVENRPEQNIYKPGMIKAYKSAKAALGGEK